MKKIIILVLIFLNFQTNLKAEIAYIDINFILNSSIVGKALNKHIKEISDTYNIDYNKIKKNLVEKEQELITQKNIIDKSEFELYSLAKN